MAEAPWMQKAQEKYRKEQLDIVKRLREMHAKVCTELGGDDMSSGEESAGEEEEHLRLIDAAKNGDIDDLSGLYEELMDSRPFCVAEQHNRWAAVDAVAAASGGGLPVPQERPPVAEGGSVEIEMDPHGAWSMLQMDTRTQRGQAFLAEFLRKQAHVSMAPQPEAFVGAIGTSLGRI
mmetsp:Transcript_57827/g.152171  ORF Transcript_57827/g.152171 Transcript_57827/m.152171 type:complete len:177 (-) Transcript_57827:64-594(-)